MSKTTVDVYKIQDLDPSGRVLNALAKKINFNIPVSSLIIKLGDIQELIPVRDFNVFYKNTDMLPTSSQVLLFGDV